MKKSILSLACAGLLLMACENSNSNTTCNSASGTELCFGGQKYTFGSVYWEQVTGHVEVELEPVIGPGKLVGLSISLDGSDIDAGNTPVVGTYTTATPSSVDPRTFYAIVVEIDGATNKTFITDTAGTGHNFEITSFASNNVSGHGNCKVYDMANNSDIRDIYFSFENLPFQP